MKLKYPYSAILLSFAVILASMTYAGHWHEDITVIHDCVVCLQDANQEDGISSKQADDLSLSSYQPISANYVSIAAYSRLVTQPRAPPYFS